MRETILAFAIAILYFSSVRAGATLVFIAVAGSCLSAEARAQEEPGTTPQRATPPPVDTAKNPAKPPASPPPTSQPSIAAQPAPSPSSASPAPSPPPRPLATEAKPPPLHIDYAEYGVALTAETVFSSPATCPSSTANLTPCILGSGGGLAIRGGYRTPGPWYYGGAYEFSKMDSSNLYRLGILQQLRAEMRYHLDLGTRAEPFATWGVGALVYGNEWGVETGGALAQLGAGVHLEVSRLAIVGLSVVWKPALIAGWTDTAGVHRATGLANFISIDIELELRSELGRR